MKGMISAVLLLVSVMAGSHHSFARTHPRLLADSADLQRARSWIRDHPWYRQIYEQNRAAIDRFISRRPIHVSPIKQTYRYKMYTCPKHDVELKYEEFRPHEHRCPVDTTEIYGGGMYDVAWSGWYNRRLASHLVWMGLLYQIYGDERYADAGREILLTFADLYLKYPTDNTILGPAHVFFGTLSESFWGVDMAYGYDLLYTYRGFSEVERTKIKEQLLYPLAKITQLFPESASNRQLWYNNVSAAVGFLYGDQELIDFALKGRYGFEWQLGSALPESGFWPEWSGYHFVALRGMIHLAEMARHNGLDLYNAVIAGRSMKKMFDAPFHVILPNYEFPRSKDSGGGNILEYAVYYEVGYAAYQDPKYAAILNLTSLGRGRQIVGEESGARETEAPITLFAIASEIPGTTSDIIPSESTDLEGNGFAILRQGSGQNRQYLYLDYGIMGGEHGHPDRLQIGYFARGRNWLVDPLNESYFNPNLQLWYRQTIAHNTPVLDQTSQSWANGTGVFFGSNRRFQVASGKSATIYPGSVVTRTLLSTEEYFVDLCDIAGPDRRLIDWPLHGSGSVSIEGVTMRKEPEDLFGHPPSTPGYDQLKNIESGITDASWKAEFRDSSGESLLVLGVAEPGTRLFRALTPPLGGFYKQMVTDRSPRPMLMSRRISSATRFAHLIHAFRGTPGVSDINAVAGGYRVRHSGGVDEIFADLHNLEFRLIRREGDRITAISGYGIEELTLEQKILVRSATRLSCLECSWSHDTLTVTSPEPLVRLAVNSPGTRVAILNGKQVESKRDGDFVVLRTATEPVMQGAGRAIDTVYAGRPNEFTVRLFNPTSSPVEGSLRISLAPDWAERVRSQREDWGGVTNLLPLHKNATERLTSGQRLDTSWIDGKSSAPKAIPPGEAGVFSIRLTPPADAARVDYPVVVSFAGVSARRKIRTIPPVSASVAMPNGPGMKLAVRFENNVAAPVNVTLELAVPPGIRVQESLRRSLLLPPRGERSFTIPFTLNGYNPGNQRYPVRVRLTHDRFTQETERDFFIGRAFHAPESPSLDGSWRGWNLSRPVTVDSLSQVCKLLLGNQPWRGAHDLSASIHVMFDERFLYVGAAVKDDSVVTTWDFPAMSYPWDTDCMEIVLDTRTRADQGTDPPTPGLRRHLSLAEYRTTSFGPEKWRGAGAGGPLLPKPLLVPGAETYHARTPDGYAMICRYPLSELGLSIGQEGYTLGFDAAINDNDGTTYRKNIHIWAGFTRNQTWWDMGTIGVILLERKPR